MTILVPSILVGALAGVAFTELSDEVYTSRADLFVSAPSSGTSADAVDAANYSREQALNFAELATRQVVLVPALADLDPPLTLTQLRGGLNVTVPRDTSIITISARDNSSLGAANMANAVAASLVTVVGDLEGNAPLSLQTIERAQPSMTAASPRPALNVLVGILAGLCVGVALTASREAVHAFGERSEEDGSTPPRIVDAEIGSSEGRIKTSAARGGARTLDRSKARG